MAEINQNIKYDGEILTDITSFSMIQNIFNGQKNVYKSQIDTFESIIQILVFFDNIWIVEPFIYGGEMKIDSQEILKELIQKKVVKQFSQIDSDANTSFKTQFEEIKDIIKPLTFVEYEKKHPTIINDLQTYEENFRLIHNPDARRLADSVNLDYSLIPLVANLLRTNFYFKVIQKAKKGENKLISYSPNVMRSSLINDIIKHKKEKITDEVNKILRDKINEIKELELRDAKELNKHLYQDYDMELPLLTALIIDECENKNDIFDQILYLRKDSNVIKMRKTLKNLQINLYCGNRKQHKAYKAQLDDVSRSLESKKSNKAKIISIFSKPTFIEASATSAVTSSFLPLFVHGIKELGNVSLEYLLQKDYYLLFKLRRQAEDISFSKEKFEKIFGCHMKTS